MFIWFLILPGLALIAVGIWYLPSRLEGQKPEFQIASFKEHIGSNSQFTIEVSDETNGLKRVWIGLLAGGKEIVLFEREYTSKWFFFGGSTKHEKIQLTIEPKKLNLPDGPILLQMKGWDYSWRRWWHGNQTAIEKNMLVDTRPPRMEIITNAHNVRQGGSGLIIYKLSEDCPEHGIMVGDNFFPGHGGYFEDPLVCLSFFALNHLQGRGTVLKVRAVDKAGNSTSSGFPHHIRDKVFKEDKIHIDENFLTTIITDLSSGKVPDNQPVLSKFLFVNRKLRENNEQKVKEIGIQTQKVLLWRDVFRCLPRAETKATFADLRHYYYNGKEIDQQRHLGVDLASNAQSEVPAGNNGKVVFCGNIGIYGNTVIIDHGYGLFSIYAHLSSFKVSAGDSVTAGQSIGNTGTTGLAGGDHLHFGMLVHNTLIDPIEWWDKEWIHNNISGKIDMASEKYSRVQ